MPLLVGFEASVNSITVVARGSRSSTTAAVTAVP